MTKKVLGDLSAPNPGVAVAGDRLGTGVKAETLLLFGKGQATAIPSGLGWVLLGCGDPSASETLSSLTHLKALQIFTDGWRCSRNVELL